MSPWSADAVRIALVPGEAALLRGQDSLVLTANDGHPASLLPRLDEAFADAAWHGRRAEVVLSQHFVRHVLTPPPGKALARSEEHALVTACLHEIYGDEAASWKVEVHSQPPHGGLLGAAVDGAFVQALDALLARHGFRDVRIRPLASVAARRQPNRPDGWWALVEPGWLSLFGARRGIWQRVSGYPVDENWAAALPELILRELPWPGLAEMPSVWVQALGVGAVAAPAARHARWQVLPHDARARGAVALAGV